MLVLCSVAEAAPDPHQLLSAAERLFWLDNFVKARPLFAQAESLFAEAGDSRNAMYARVSRLRADGDRTGYPAVSQYIGEQLGSPLVQNDAKLRLRCLIVKASIDLSIDPASSTATWKEAELLASELKELGWANRAKTELGIVAFLQGNTQAAQKAMSEAIRTSILLGDIAGQVRQLSLVAVGLGELGLNDRALRYADQALDLAANNPDVRFPLMANMAKMKSLEALGRAEEAGILLAEILQFVESTGMGVYRADVLLAVAIRAEEKGKMDDAIRHLRQAVESAEAVGMPRPAASALFRLAQIYERQGDIAQAETTIDRAVETTRQLVDMYVLPRQLAKAAEIKVRARKPQVAAELFDEAADLVDAMLVNVPTTGLRASLIAVMSEIYEGYTDLTLRHLNDPVRAFGIIERARGRTATDALRSGEPTSVPPGTSAVREVANIQIQLQTARSPQRRRELLTRLAEAEEHMLSDVRATSTTTRTAPSPPAELSAVQRLLRQDEAILEYVLGDRVSHVLLITKEALDVVPLPPRSKIESMGRPVLGQLKTCATNTAAALRVLSSVLLPPAIKTKKRLVIVPDGVLHTFPFDVLLGPGGKDLCETHVVSYAPSATTLTILRSRPPGRPDRLPVLAVGGVGIREQDIASADRAQRYRTTRGLFEVTAATLPVLPATDREVDSVRAVYGLKSVVLKRAAATEASFKRQPLDRFRILHLAVHGLVDSKFPERSALVLTPSPPDHEDGLLQIREIALMKLNADLVTLSACDTSLGRIEGQEGVANFVRAFLQAGSRNVVSALWEVDDSIAARIMANFHAHLAKGASPGESLRWAKLDFRKRYGATSHPSHWAAFQLTGQ